MYEYIRQNLAEVKKEIAAAEETVGRNGDTVMLAAVKYAADGEIAAMLDAGVTDVGENRVQQFLANLPLYESRDVRVHFIGSLQTNKVKYIAGRVDMIHSLDSEKLALEIEKRAAARDRVIDVLVEINSGREASKSGVLPEDVCALCRCVLTLPHLHLAGFMTMGPVCESEEEYRAYFAKTAALGKRLWRELQLTGEPVLSMGMSQSFSAAIKEGAHFVRVGRRLFAGREETQSSK